jgi:hypothetical protein
LVVFVLGPCETLIPLMTAPGLVSDWSTVTAVVSVFGAVTVLAMLLMVGVLHAGLAGARLSFAGRYATVAAGLALAGSGLTVQLLGV